MGIYKAWGLYTFEYTGLSFLYKIVNIGLRVYSLQGSEFQGFRVWERSPEPFCEF